MGLYNFHPRFVPYVEDWSKRHTIRGERTHPDSPGSAMHLYTGLRHPGARCLMRPLCVRSEFIRIEGGPNHPHRILMGFSLGLGHDEDARSGWQNPPIYGSVTGGPLVRLVIDEANELAWRDGFREPHSSLEDPGDALGLMMRFWSQRLPFEGSIYHWNPAKQIVKNRYGSWRLENVAARCSSAGGRPTDLVYRAKSTIKLARKASR